MTNPFKKPRLPQKPFGELSQGEFDEWHKEYARHYKAREALPFYLSLVAIIISILSLLISLL